MIRFDVVGFTVTKETLYINTVYIQLQYIVSTDFG